MSVEKNKLVVREFIEETLNKGNVDAAGDYVSDGVVEMVPLPGQAGLKDVLRGMRIAFPDLHRTIEEQIAEADKVLTRFIWAGTHKAEFLGVPATGHQVSVWGW
jgi:predicted ester cyclase